ncbi:translation initiation factor IF-6 [Cuniculiplasma sp. SKW3]|uniref:translation initiation factor IF-6 n=1 Tax=unclassified Cuniculiplasma TaxID=2619706 RepID=UPI003FD00354
MIRKFSIFESEFIGLYCRAWDDMAIVPVQLDDLSRKTISEVLDVSIQESRMDPSGMYGVFSVMNSNGIIVGGNSGKIDFDPGKRRVLYLRDTINAVGNDIVANDHGAMVHEDFDNKSVKMIEETLDVETVKGRMGVFQTVGSGSVATNKGMIVNPEVSDDDIEILKDIFKVPVSAGTANFGSPMVGASLIANTKGILVGEKTTSIEIGGIDDVLS